MQPIGKDEGLSWDDFCDAAELPRTITPDKTNLAASKERQGQSLDAWYETAVEAVMKGKGPKPKKEKPLIEPARKPVKVKAGKEQEPFVRKPREILQTPVNSQLTFWGTE